MSNLDRVALTGEYDYLEELISCNLSYFYNFEDELLFPTINLKESEVIYGLGLWVMEPRDAATVMLVRNSDNSSEGPIEVFMLRRNLNLDFVGGAYVFPGGAVDELDQAIADDQELAGRPDHKSGSLLGTNDGGVKFWVAAIRECFEEAGVLLARRSASEGVLSLVDAGDRALFDGYRQALNRKEATFESILRAEGLTLLSDSIFYFSHWITPEGAPRRYDTRFFVAVAPPDQVALHDNGETVANCWISPNDALNRHRNSEFDLILPTIKNLEALARFSNVAEVISAASAFETIPTVLPRMVPDGNGVRILLPGDQGYEEALSAEFSPTMPLPGRPGGPAI
ncbi:NUDIX hydrolase [Acidithrix ferrooxidans]|uniref:NUDIX domain protein n=1 Tax=Acidithrix ferrooxidans TaxID=1280514 RepID=A0A0D8HLY6_9ACTN|nr:NUDIX domain-containing protein [Acidithrix ferrooxidans]KJF18923.1 NUDIX domain protein [Acidithrix ferrooxidans]